MAAQEIGTFVIIAVDAAVSVVVDAVVADFGWCGRTTVEAELAVWGAGDETRDV